MNEKFILTLIEKFDASRAAELDLNDGTTRLILKKAGGCSGGGAQNAAGPAVSEVHLGLPPAVKVPAEGPAAGGEIITSPIVATFYAAPGPDAPPFVRAGSRVKAGDTLCILEAMKMMNHLEAEFDCEILSVLAGTGDLIEYDQALFEVKRL
ncbi:MAG: acetyl-CoA carboxylase biotin carboxyl carrier protein [Treponema sp.]|jgi:acetyl-CoA carboxylase biotin carboxyl carrier protein|nr:acetyl-CoA carboxylase biotin carboxyl carrier protein [Treponema sp.]